MRGGNIGLPWILMHDWYSVSSLSESQFKGAVDNVSISRMISDIVFSNSAKELLALLLGVSQLAILIWEGKWVTKAENLVRLFMKFHFWQYNFLQIFYLFWYFAASFWKIEHSVFVLGYCALWNSKIKTFSTNELTCNVITEKDSLNFSVIFQTAEETCWFIYGQK